MRPDHSGSMSLYSPILVFLAIMMITLPGCGGEEVAPTAVVGLDAVVCNGPDLAAASADTRGAHNEYPLEAGNWWNYDGSLTFMVDGGSTETHIYTRDHSIWGTEELFGREYIVERRTVDEMMGMSSVDYWIRNRQDKTGLYEADYSITAPPGDWNPGGMAVLAVAGRKADFENICLPGHLGIEEVNIGAFLEARERLLVKMEAVEQLRATVRLSVKAGRKGGGVLEGEITRLAYPLRPGQEWVIRVEPFFGASVTGREKVDTPAGTFNCYKISISSALFGNNDTVYQWYGKEGLIGTFAHLESEMTDPSGNPVGLLTSEEGYFLAAYGSSGEDCEEVVPGVGDGSFWNKGEIGSE